MLCLSYYCFWAAVGVLGSTQQSTWSRDRPCHTAWRRSEAYVRLPDGCVSSLKLRLVCGEEEGRTCHIRCSSGVEFCAAGQSQENIALVWQRWKCTYPMVESQQCVFTMIRNSGRRTEKKSTSGAGRAMFLFKCDAADCKALSRGSIFLCRIILKIDKSQLSCVLHVTRKRSNLP